MTTRTLLALLGAIAVGLLAGYFLFAGAPEPGNDHAAHGSAPAAAASVWTCSMHPQIQQQEPGDCPLCGMDLIPLDERATSDPTVLTMTEAAVALARVRTVRVREAGADAGAVPSMNDGEGIPIRLTGRLAADERTTAVEVSEFGGRVERLFVSFAGEPVRAGQRIATVYAPDLVIAQEELLQALRFRDVNPDLVAAARTKLRNLKVSDEQIATLEERGEIITEFPIYADRSGTILETKVEVGEYVRAGGALYTYTDLSKIWALFDAYEGDLARIGVGDRVTFSVPAQPGRTYRARVTFIDPAIDPTTRTAAVRAEVSNPGGRLKPAMFVAGTVFTRADPPGGVGETGSAAAGFVVPRSAVLWTGERSVVYVAVPEAAVPTYVFREVTVGERVGEGYRITDGLEAGEHIVVNGAFQLDAAAQLSNQASMMNRDVLIAGREAAGVTAMAVPNYREATPEAVREQLGRVVTAYLPLKDRLVATERADRALLAPLQRALAAVDNDLVTGEARTYWTQQLEAVSAHADQLIAATDVEEQRRQFQFLSQALINTLVAFGVDDTYYVQHCPMAFDNAGANWVSDEFQIMNPYFGDRMLRCGTVTETLQ